MYPILEKKKKNKKKLNKIRNSAIKKQTNKQTKQKTNKQEGNWVKLAFAKTYGIIRKRIIAVIDANFAVGERKPEKIQACTVFEPLISAIPVQRSRSLNWFVINP